MVQFGTTNERGNFEETKSKTNERHVRVGSSGPVGSVWLIKSAENRGRRMDRGGEKKKEIKERVE